MSRVIEPHELQNPNTVTVARWLLGKTLVRTRGGRRVAARITEVEAYHGESDLACHASRGRTRRTDVMYSAGGVWYVYLCYGIHEMLNLVTGPEHFPSAILIRGVEGLSGPGRLTKGLAVDRRFNAQPAHPTSGLHLEDDGFEVPKRAVRMGPRVGVDYAGPVWANKPWRFWFVP
ncbi:MAG TPA: DNA-3-methyladenine glycosylase [Opitutaceae bacterium]|nr:DNA-3-methyladenine glycosylase [Opitutaceae bacterium]